MSCPQYAIHVLVDGYDIFNGRHEILGRPPSGSNEQLDYAALDQYTRTPQRRDGQRLRLTPVPEYYDTQRGLRPGPNPFYHALTVRNYTLKLSNPTDIYGREHCRHLLDRFSELRECHCRIAYVCGGAANPAVRAALLEATADRQVFLLHFSLITQFSEEELESFANAVDLTRIEVAPSLFAPPPAAEPPPEPVPEPAAEPVVEEIPEPELPPRPPGHVGPQQLLALNELAAVSLRFWRR